MLKLIFSVCLALCLAACSAGSKGKPELVGNQAPYVRLVALDGAPHVLEEYKGRTIVLIFWAQWCHRSNQSIARLNSLAERLKRSRDLAFVAVSVDKAEDFEKLKNKISINSLSSFDHFFSGNEGNDEAFVSFGGGELPLIFIIDPRGSVVATGGHDEFVFEYFGQVGK